MNRVGFVLLVLTMAVILIAWATYLGYLAVNHPVGLPWCVAGVLIYFIIKNQRNKDR